MTTKDKISKEDKISKDKAEREFNRGTLIGEDTGIPMVDEDGKLKRYHGKPFDPEEADVDDLENEATDPDIDSDQTSKAQRAKERQAANKEYSPLGNV